MAISSIVKGISTIDRIMISANVLFILAFLFLTKSMSFRGIEYMILGLVLLSLFITIVKISNKLIQIYSVAVDGVNLTIAGFIAVRYGLAFVTDFNRFVALILFLATVGFSVVFVLSVRRIIFTVTRANVVESAAQEDRQMNAESK